jgi:hypothetical protein
MEEDRSFRYEDKFIPILEKMLGQFGSMKQKD